MKSIILGLTFVLIAALFQPTFAATPFRPFVLNLAPGSSPATVRHVLGAPSAMLRPDLWIYWKFAGSNGNDANPEFDTLVIAFTDGRVTAVKMTDGRVVRQLLAQQEALLAKTNIAAK